jgi:TatD DNase family protein
MTLMGPYFETHCHLQDERFSQGLQAVLERGREAGITHFACCGCSEADWVPVLNLARCEHDIVPLLGLHPWYIEEASHDWLRRLEDMLADHRAGLGECGLDFALEDTDRTLQLQMLRAQIQLARCMDVPMSIHCRKAWESLLALTRELGLPAKGAVIHAYSGSAEMAKELQELGYYISFSCSLANPQNHKGAKALKAVSLDRLLFETDAPDMPPPGFEVNEPANIRLVSSAAAALLEMDEERLNEKVHENALRLFGSLLPKG